MTDQKLGVHQMGTILFFLTRACFSLFGYQFLLKEAGSELKVKELGRLRLEGKDYLMQDGDICYFRFNV